MSLFFGFGSLSCLRALYTTVFTPFLWVALFCISNVLTTCWIIVCNLFIFFFSFLIVLVVLFCLFWFPQLMQNDRISVFPFFVVVYVGLFVCLFVCWFQLHLLTDKEICTHLNISSRLKRFWITFDYFAYVFFCHGCVTISIFRLSSCENKMNEWWKKRDRRIE